MCTVAYYFDRLFTHGQLVLECFFLSLKISLCVRYYLHRSSRPSVFFGPLRYLCLHRFIFTDHPRLISVSDVLLSFKISLVSGATGPPAKFKDTFFNRILKPRFCLLTVARRESETCMVWACHTPRQPLQNRPSGHLGRWATPWWAEEMLDEHHQRVDIPAHARTAHKGLLHKRLEEDLC